MGAEKTGVVGAKSWSQLQPQSRIGGAFLMKDCNQVAYANLPHPKRLTCQNASHMTEGFVLKKTMMATSLHVMRKKE